MDPEQLINKFLGHQKNVQSAIKLLRQIVQLDQNRKENLPKLRARVSKLEEIRRLGQGESYVQELADWIDQYKSTIESEAEEIRKQFGAELEQELRQLGLSLSGQYPELNAGLFTIELDFDKGKTTLWYGPKQERLDQCPLSVNKIVIHLERARQELGSQLPEEELLEKLREAYYRAVGTKRGEPVPIIRVLAELAFLLQGPRFLQDPKQENYKSYGRADFSYDLFRIRRFFLKHSRFSKIHLTIATRSYTRRRSDFLWVPDGENGEGTTYSHLRFEEGS